MISCIIKRGSFYDHLFPLFDGYFSNSLLPKNNGIMDGEHLTEPERIYYCMVEISMGYLLLLVSRRHNIVVQKFVSLTALA